MGHEILETLKRGNYFSLTCGVDNQPLRLEDSNVFIALSGILNGFVEEPEVGSCSGGGVSSQPTEQQLIANSRRETLHAVLSHFDAERLTEERARSLAKSVNAAYDELLNPSTSATTDPDIERAQSCAGVIPPTATLLGFDFYVDQSSKVTTIITPNGSPGRATVNTDELHTALQAFYELRT